MLSHGSRILVFAHPDEARSFIDVEHAVTGFGKVGAAVGLACLLAAGDVRTVTVLGTAGIVADSLDLNTVYEVTGVFEHDFEFTGEEIALPLAGGAAAFSPERMSGVSGVKIATGDAFVKDDATRGRLASRGASLVDMETYAYARVCQSFGVGLQVFKIPSDFADSATTDAQWDEIVVERSARLHDFWRCRLAV